MLTKMPLQPPVEAASSSLVTQTISNVHNESDEHSIFFCLYFIVWSRISALFLLLCRGGQICTIDLLSSFRLFILGQRTPEASLGGKAYI